MHSFCKQQLGVKHLGRRFLCRAPTVQTIHWLLQLFYVELAGLIKAVQALPAGQSWTTLLHAYTARDRIKLAVLLSTCVELWQGAPGELEELVQDNQDLALQLIQAVVHLADVEAISESMALDRLPEISKEQREQTAEEMVSAQDRAVCHVAMLFHQSPEQVMQWSYMAFVRAMDAVLAIRSGVDPSDSSRWVTQTGQIPGIAVETASA